MDPQHPQQAQDTMDNVPVLPTFPFAPHPQQHTMQPPPTSSSVDSSAAAHVYFLQHSCASLQYQSQQLQSMVVAANQQCAALDAARSEMEQQVVVANRQCDDLDKMWRERLASQTRTHQAKQEAAAQALSASHLAALIASDARWTASEASAKASSEALTETEKQLADLKATSKKQLEEMTAAHEKHVHDLKFAIDTATNEHEMTLSHLAKSAKTVSELEKRLAVLMSEGAAAKKSVALAATQQQPSVAHKVELSSLGKQLTESRAMCESLRSQLAQHQERSKLEIAGAEKTLFDRLTVAESTLVEVRASSDKILCDVRKQHENAMRLKEAELRRKTESATKWQNQAMDLQRQLKVSSSNETTPVKKGKAGKQVAVTVQQVVHTKPIVESKEREEKSLQDRFHDCMERLTISAQTHVFAASYNESVRADNDALWRMTEAAFECPSKTSLSSHLRKKPSSSSHASQQHEDVKDEGKHGDVDASITDDSDLIMLKVARGIQDPIKILSLVRVLERLLRDDRSYYMSTIRTLAEDMIVMYTYFLAYVPGMSGEHSNRCATILKKSDEIIRSTRSRVSGTNEWLSHIHSKPAAACDRALELIDD